jgi:ApaG protein
MSAHFVELPGLKVHVDHVAYMPHLEAPPDKPHPFVYFISIHNRSDRALTIRGRKWIVTELTGERVVVEGDGVVGKCPHLDPGESFSYNSYHVVAGPCTAEGAYFGICDDGLPVFTRIPSFELVPPE